MFDVKRTLARAGVVAALIGVELYLARDLTSHAAVQGYTATNSYSIAPPRRAKISTLAVVLGTTVKQGDTIAQLDTTDVDNEIAAAELERAYASAAVVAEAARLRRDSVNLERRFASGTERASADLATAEASAHTAAAELAAVDAELVEQSDLVAKHLASADALNTLQLRRAALAKQVDAATEVLRVLRGNVSAATKRTGDLSASDDDQLAPLQARLHAAELKLTQLTAQKTGLTLRAPADGVIDELPLHAGDLAAPDQPVATLVAPDATRVVACIPEARAKTVEMGLEAEVTSTYDHELGTGEIESVTGTIAPLPARCQPPGAKVPAMGRVAIVALDAPMSGLPGQTQMVSISARRRPPRTRSQPSAGSSTPAPAKQDPAPQAEPALLPLPGDLAARTRFEPSGVVWVAALGRYLMVSDDTGEKKSPDNHAPWLFAMTDKGAIDAQPIVIGGVDTIDDPESIALDADGALWILASQSTSKKGKWPEARRRLVHAVIDKGGIRADKVLDLGGLLDAAPAAARTALGIGEPRALDIEAMAAHGGALYLGLKAPVDGDGRAMIWKVASPAKLLAGDLAGAGLSIWSRVKLTVEADGRAVPAGFADLMFWDDGTLVFSVTASGFNPSMQSGAVYAATAAAGDLAPRRVRTFTGLKPEGLARAPSGELTVVFDRGGEPAMWTQLPAEAVTGAK